MKFPTMLAALCYLLPHFDTSFEVQQIRQFIEDSMPECPTWPSLPPSDAYWITEAVCGNNPEVVSNEWFIVTGGGEALLGHILVFYDNNGGIVRVYAG